MSTPILTSARRRLRRGNVSPMRLEPRVMFDGALVDTVDTHTVQLSDEVFAAPPATEPTQLQQESVEQAATAYEAPALFLLADAERTALQSSIDLAQQAIVEYLSSIDAETLFQTFSGQQEAPSADWLAAAEALRQDILAGRYSVDTMVVGRDELGSTPAAFAATGPGGRPTIFFNRDWFAEQIDEARVTRILVEEFGHSVDHVLNPVSDTQGDEGEAFAVAVLKLSTNFIDEARIAIQDDRATIQVDGEVFEVETANFNFANAYQVTNIADKESNLHTFDYSSPLGAVLVDDQENSRYFSGNDVSAVGIVVNGQTYYGWISRPIKANGIVRGFYFWTDADFNDPVTGGLGVAQADGNTDGDRNAGDNSGFILVVDQAYFDGLKVTSGASIKSVGSSSDKVDGSLNALIVPNQGPVPVNDVRVISEDSAPATGNVLDNDSDPDNDILTVSGYTIGGVAGTLGQSFVISGVGSFTLAASGSYSFTPQADYTGPVPVIQYTVSDGNLTATATLSITVQPVNDAPQGADATLTVRQNQSYTFSAADFGFSDPKDSPAHGLKSVIVTTLPVLGSLTLNGVAVTAGQEILAADIPKLQFSAAPDQSGLAYASFTFQVRDTGGVANGGVDLDPTPNTLTFNVTAVNRAPVASPDAIEITEGTAQVTNNVRSNDSDPDGDVLTVTGAAGANPGQLTGGEFVVDGQFGRLFIAVDGSYRYELDNTLAAVKSLRLATNTLTEHFSYEVADGDGLTAVSTLTITIRGANNAPLASPDHDIAKESIAGSDHYGAGDTTGFKAVGNVLDNDSDADGYGETLVVVGIEAAASGSTDGTSTTSVAFTLSQGSASVSQNDYIWLRTGGAGTAQNPYTWEPLSDGQNHIRVATISSQASTLTFSAEPSSALANGAVIGFTSGSSLPQNQNSLKSATINSSSTTITATNSVTVSNVTGQIYVGMTITGTDPSSGAFSQTVTQVNGVVVTFDGAARSLSNVALSFSASPGTTLTGQFGTLVLDADGGYTYTPIANNPALNQGDLRTESFRYVIRDVSGVTSSSTLTITVLGSGVGDPVLVADTNEIHVGSTPPVAEDATTGLLSNDPSATAVAGARSATTATETVVDSNTQIQGQYGTLTVSANGSYSYALDNSLDVVAALPLGGILADTFFYRATNGGSGSSLSTLTIVIKGTNAAPVAEADAATAREAGGYDNDAPGVNPAGNVLLNDRDVNVGDELVVSLVEAGASITGGASPVATSSSASGGGTSVSGLYGTLVIGADGSYAYTVNNGHPDVQALNMGTAPLVDVFSYTVIDGKGGSHSTTLTISVLGSNDAPENTVPAGPVLVNEGEAVALPGLVVDDVDDSSLTVSLSVGGGALTVGDLHGAAITSGANHTGMLTLSGTRAALNAALSTLSYQGTPGFSGDDTLRMETSDAAGLTDNSVLRIQVAPDARNLAVTGTEVNEASPYVVFRVSGAVGQQFALRLAETGVGEGHASIGLDLSPSLQYFDGNAWVDYSSLLVTVPPSGVLLVRAAVFQDALSEGVESIRLVATNKAGVDYHGDSTIRDDAQGNIFLGGNADLDLDPDTITTYLDDDRPISVNDIVLNEASPFAVFTIQGQTGQVIRLGLHEGSAKQVGSSNAELEPTSDFGPGLQYFNGTSWVNYVPGSDLTLISTTLLVRTALINDAVYEGQEGFSLGVTKMSSGVTTYGIANIYDDGTGGIQTGAVDGDGAPVMGTTPLDDDRSIAIDSPEVNEASDLVIFTVTGNPGQTVTLALTNQTATLPLSGVIKVYAGEDDAGDPIWEDYDPSAALPTFNAAGILYVAVDIRAEQDADFEGPETFHLTATLARQVFDEDANVTNVESVSPSQQVVGVATIFDDGTALRFTGHITDTGPTTSSDALDDDRASGDLLVSSPTVNEASPFAVFVVSGTEGQSITLALAGVTAAAGGVDFGPGLAFSVDGGSTWSPYNAAFVMPASGSVLVRTPIINDSLDEGQETFTLTATPAGGTPAVGTATINDHGAGVVFNDDGTENGTAGKDDDRASDPSPQPEPQPVPPVVPDVVPPAEPDPAPPRAIDTVADEPPAPSLPADWVDQISNGGISTSDELSSFDFGSVPARGDGGHELRNDRDIPDVPMAGPGGALNFAIPSDTFAHTDPQAQINLIATMADGSPLPSWLSFNPATGQFVGTPPANFRGDLQLRVVARDDAGRQAETQVRLVAGQTAGSGAGVVAGEQLSTATPLRQVDGTAFSGSTTSVSGFPVMVDVQGASGGEHRLQVARAIPAQSFDTGAAEIVFVIPVDAFTHTDRTARVELSAAMVDGRALPAWLSFDARKGQFKGTPPAGFQGELLIKVIARDESGRQAETIVRVRVGTSVERVESQGRPGLSTQLRTGGVFGWKLERDRLIQQARDVAMRDADKAVRADGEPTEDAAAVMADESV